MKKAFTFLITGVVSVGILAGLTLGKSNSKVLANSLINNNKLSKYKADYKFSIKDARNNNPIKLSLNVTNDLNESNSIIDSKVKIKDMNEEVIIYSTKDKDFIKLQNFDNYIYCPNTTSSINLRLVTFNKSLAYKSFKNFEKYICDLSSKKKIKLENHKDMKVLNLELNRNEIKILYDKFIEINMGDVKDLFMENIINESETLNDKKLSLDNRDTLKDKTQKELEQSINNIISTVYIDKMKVSLYIDKNKKLLKEYKTTTEVLVNEKKFFINLDYKLIDYGDSVQVENVDIKNALSYEEFLKSNFKN